MVAAIQRRSTVATLMSLAASPLSYDSVIISPYCSSHHRLSDVLRINQRSPSRVQADTINDLQLWDTSLISMLTWSGTSRVGNESMTLYTRLAPDQRRTGRSLVCLAILCRYCTNRHMLSSGRQPYLPDGPLNALFFSPCVHLK